MRPFVNLISSTRAQSGYCNLQHLTMEKQGKTNKHRKMVNGASATLALSLLLTCTSLPESEGFAARHEFRRTQRLPVNQLILPRAFSDWDGNKDVTSQRSAKFSLSKHPWKKPLARLFSTQNRINSGLQQEFSLRKKTRLLVSLSAAMVGLTVMMCPLRAVASTIVDSSAGPIMSSVGGMLASPAVTAVSGSTTTSMIASQAQFFGSPPVSTQMEIRLCFRLLYAALLGAGLGKERSFAKHSAGVRTMALVAMGAAAYTICSTFGFLAFGKYDPSRMAANVASGVGFIGAGVITTTMSNRSQNVVHGLTTAAAIWISAAIGVASGVGLFFMAGTTTLATISILRLGRVKPKNRRTEGPMSSSVSALHSHAHVSDPETHDTTDWDEHNDHIIEPRIPTSEINRRHPQVQENSDSLGDVDVPALAADDDGNIYPEPIIVGQNKAMDKVLESILQSPEQLKRLRIRDERKSHNVTTTSNARP